MKKLLISVFTLTVFIFTTLTVFASNKEKESKSEARQKIESNLLMGIKSDNEGLRISSAYFLGELKSEKALLPLMEMLRSEENEGARLMAALSLVKIGSERGLYMLKREAQFNSSKRVRNMCKIFYNAYQMDKVFTNVDKNLKYATLN